MDSLTDLTLLSKMLDDSTKQDEDRQAQQAVSKLGPGDIGPPKKPSEAEAKEKKKKDPNAIWDEEEVDEAKLLNLVNKNDNRARWSLKHTIVLNLQLSESVSSQICAKRMSA